MNNESKIWELFYLGLTPNAMFTVAMVLLTWLGFRFAAAINAEPDAPMLRKVTATIFYLIVGIMFYNLAQIGGMMASAAAESLSKLPEISNSSQAFIERVESGFILGGPLSIAFNLVVIFMQIVTTWSKKNVT